MCDCHPLTPELREAIKATEGEENTKEDWRDLHDAIESYRRRRAARHVLAHVESAQANPARFKPADVGKASGSAT